MQLMLKEIDDQDPYNLTIRGPEDQGPNNWPVYGNRIKSLKDELQGLGFNDSLVDPIT